MYYLLYQRLDGQVYVCDFEELSEAIEAIEQVVPTIEQFKQMDEGCLNLWHDYPTCSITRRYMIVRGELMAEDRN